MSDSPDRQYRLASPSDPRRHIYTDGVHLVVDGDQSIDLLHQFARRIGLKPEWFQQFPEPGHYDLTTPNAAERAVASGATLVGMRDVVRVMRPTGHPKRPAGFRPSVLGVGAPAFRLAREAHGDVMEFIQGPGNRAWLGNNTMRNRVHPEGGRQPRVVRLG
jgi:hypothetical protein